jgi:hypothetical protein
MNREEKTIKLYCKGVTCLGQLCHAVVVAILQKTTKEKVYISLSGVHTENLARNFITFLEKKAKTIKHKIYFRGETIPVADILKRIVIVRFPQYVHANFSGGLKLVSWS